MLSNILCRQVERCLVKHTTTTHWIIAIHLHELPHTVQVTRYNCIMQAIITHGLAND